MILYDQNLDYGLLEFGIQIPISNTTPQKLIAQFKQDHKQHFLITEQAYFNPQTITRQDLLRTHSRQYINKLFSDQIETEVIRAYELIDEQGNYHRYLPEQAKKPLSQFLERALRITSGTYSCCQIALEKGAAFYLGGGMHHAHRDFGSGFCLINDIVIAARKVLAHFSLKNAWIIDLDAHKGDGTASLTLNDPFIKTLSIHMAEGWPLNMPRLDRQNQLNPAFIASNIDIPVKSGAENYYNALLKNGLDKLAALSRADIALVLAGADPYEKDELQSSGKINLSLAQLKERDLMVYHFLKEKKIPAAYVSAGGYGENTWRVYWQFLDAITH